MLIISWLVKTSVILMPLAGKTSLNINMQNIEAICLFHSWDTQLELLLVLEEQYIKMTVPLGSVRKTLHYIFFIEILSCPTVLYVTEEFYMNVVPAIMFALGGVLYCKKND